MTEKTWKPIANGQFFMVFGSPGIIEFLRTQGVDVFDDIINHHYDSELEWDKRLNMIHDEMDRLVTLDLENLFYNTKERRQLNQSKFHDGSFDPSGYHANILSIINKNK